jgi:hypothetical protein
MTKVYISQDELWPVYKIEDADEASDYVKTTSQYYALADLTGANGTFSVSYAQTGDTIFMALGGYPPQKLIRVGNTNWQFSPADIKNGPFIGLNPDEATTVYASAATGTERTGGEP